MYNEKDKTCKVGKYDSRENNDTNYGFSNQ